MAKIAIDAGHYKYEPGRRCLKAYDPNETREWTMNARVADELEKLLQSAGHETKRMDDTTGEKLIDIYARARIANQWGADYYISIHHNGGINGGSGGGTVVFVCPGTGAKSIQTQKAIYNHAIARGNLKGNRSNPLPSASFVVLTNTNMPAALIECGFMDAPDDIPYIINPEWSKKMALGIAEGICEVWGGTVTADSVTPSKKPAAEPTKPTESTPAVKPTTKPSSTKKNLMGQTGPNPTFKYSNEYDPSVKELQNILNTGAGANLKEDGLAGPLTYKAVSKFTVEKGDNGRLIKWVQERLNILDYDSGDEDGKAGDLTMAAIARFQKAYGLGVGYLGGTDWYYMIES